MILVDSDDQIETWDHLLDKRYLAGYMHGPSSGVLVLPNGLTQAWPLYLAGSLEAHSGGLHGSNQLQTVNCMAVLLIPLLVELKFLQ